jgi:hypothetical protein
VSFEKHARTFPSAGTVTLGLGIANQGTTAGSTSTQASP